MRRLICAKLASVTAIGFSSIVFVATNSANAEPYNWAGFYIGANVGEHESRDSDPAYISANNNFIPGAVAQINSVLPVTLTPTGPAGGLQAGYNWQFSNTVLGLEADIDALGGSASRYSSMGLLADPAEDPISDSAQDRWMSTLRARLGYAYEHGLFYVTGGAAWSTWKTQHYFAYGLGGGFSAIGVDNNTVSRIGWTVGGGVEAPLFGNWIGRMEYLYANFGTTTSYIITVPSAGAFITNIAEPEKLSEQIFRLGVSYQFH